jgi:hypothetical protein
LRLNFSKSTKIETITPIIEAPENLSLKDPIAQIKQFTFKDFQEITKMKLSVANTLVALPCFLSFSNPLSLISLLQFATATQLMAMST